MEDFVLAATGPKHRNTRFLMDGLEPDIKELIRSSANFRAAKSRTKTDMDCILQSNRESSSVPCMDGPISRQTRKGDMLSHVRTLSPFNPRG